MRGGDGRPGQNPDVGEHEAVGAAESHHGLEFFGDDRFGREVAKLRNAVEGLVQDEVHNAAQPQPRWLIGYERQFQCGFLSFERSIPARPCADRCATGKCQPCLIAMKRRLKHKAPPASAEMP